MKRKSTFPKYLIGDAGPVPDHSDIEEQHFILRTRNPFILGRVEQVGMVGLHLHLWPASAATECSPLKLTKIAAEMLSIYAAEVEELPGLPKGWTFAFSETYNPPEYLLFDAAHGADFTGVLCTMTPPILFQ